MTERLGRPDGARIRDTTIEAADMLALPGGERLVRIHLLAGAHPSAWNEFRKYGPTTSRFDHHMGRKRDHPSRRIAYLTRGADAFTAAVAEFFQDDNIGVRPIDTHLNRPNVAVLDTVRPLHLLDLDGGWVTRAGGNQAIRTGLRSRSRDWSRIIYRHHPGLDGLAYSSSVWGPGRCVALWERAEDAFPPAPTNSRTLDDPTLAPAVAVAALQLGTVIL